MSLRALGPLEMTVDGHAPDPKLEWKGPKALLVYLSFTPRHVRSKTEVMGTLWPDGSRPAHSLQQACYQLRDMGGVGVTEVGDHVRLDPATVELDTTRFEQWEREHRWSEAAAMIAGEFLEGFQVPQTYGFEEWVEAERARWRRKCGLVLAREAEALLSAGGPERAESFAARAMQFVPTYDDACRVHLIALIRLGRRHEAIDVAEQFFKRLTDLHTKPEAETIRLIKTIKEHDGKPTPTLQKAKARGPLVGRAEQLAKVRGCWKASVGGQASVALVSGEAGMGKTRFADEVIEQAVLDQASVAIVHAIPGDEKHARIGLRTLLDGGLLRAPGVATASPAAIAGVGVECPQWTERFPISPRAEPLAFMAAVTEVIRAAASEAPVLLVVDDAQEMDPDSWHALVGLVRSLSTSRLMVLMTASSDPHRDELEQLGAHLGRDLRGVAVTLEPLKYADLVALAEWALPDYAADELDRIARRVNVESGGLPLIAYAILTAVAEGLELRPATQHWPPKGRTLHTVLPAELPDSLRGAINVAFGRLASDAKTVLRVVSVLGEPCSGARVGLGSELPPPRLDKALDYLEWKRWLVADARGYAFVARAIRDLIRARHVGKASAERIQERVMGA